MIGRKNKRSSIDDTLKGLGDRFKNSKTLLDEGKDGFLSKFKGYNVEVGKYTKKSLVGGAVVLGTLIMPFGFILTGLGVAAGSWYAWANGKEALKSIDGGNSASSYGRKDRKKTRFYSDEK